MIDIPSLIDRIKKQDRSECDESLTQEMDKWLKRLDELNALKILADHFVIKDLIAEYENQIKSIDAKLLGQRVMTDLERLNLLDRKDLYKDFIHFFDAEARLEELSRIVSENL